MKKLIMSAAIAATLSACGGSGSGSSAPSAPSTPPPTSFNLAAAQQLMRTNGYSVQFQVSGNTLDGTAISGEVAFDDAPAVAASGMFSGQSVSAAWAQTVTVTGTINGTSYASSVVGYVAANGDELGTVASGETDIAQSPIAFPSIIHIGDTEVLGVLNCYDGVLPLGTKTVSYVVKANPASADSVIFELIENWSFATGTYSSQEDDIITASGTGSSVSSIAVQQSFLGATANTVFQAN